DLFTSEVLFQRGRRRRLRLVPLAIVFRRGMDVVGGRVVILDLNRLSCHYAENMGMVLAALLIEYDRILGRIKGAIAQAIFYIHEDVSQVAATDHDAFGFIGALAAG